MFITLTPWVGRPICEMPPARVRWDHPVLGDEEQVLVLTDDQRPGEAALLRGQLRGQHAFGAAALDRVLGYLGALAIAVFGDDEELGVVAGDVHRQHAIGDAVDLGGGRSSL
jgi:hypothetical protein